MNKLKRLFVSAVAIVMLLSALGFAGCKRDIIIEDAKTINVRVFSGGYGSDWIYELKSKFEAAYAREGYKVNILTPSLDLRGDVVINELLDGNEKTGIDLYFTTDIYAETVATGDHGMLVEDLTDDVFNKPAIGFDGQEESVTIKSKIKPGADVSMLATVADEDRYFGFNWVSSVGGLAVNTKKLDAYGFELPKTTNEMLDTFQAIYLGTNGRPNSEEAKTFPITYVQGSNGYTLCMLNALFAQYTGYDNFERFWSLIDTDGTPMTTDGNTVFEDQGLYEMLKVAYATFDPRIAAYGSQSQSVDQAQGKIMSDLGTNDAIFMCVGDWMLNEVRLNYPNKLNEIEFINFPVISALGVELFGEGSSYKLDDEACDELLSYLVGLVDENLDIDEIVSRTQTEKGITISEADARRVAEARGVYFSRGVEHLAFIPKNARAAEPAKLLLRMFASEDFAPIFAQTTNGTSPYTESVNTDTPYKFVEEASRIAVNQYASIIISYPTGLRRDLSLMTMFTNYRHIPMAIVEQEISMFDGKGNIESGKTRQVYADAAKKMWESEKKNVNDNWKDWIKGLD